MTRLFRHVTAAGSDRVQVVWFLPIEFRACLAVLPEEITKEIERGIQRYLTLYRVLLSSARVHPSFAADRFINVIRCEISLLPELQDFYPHFVMYN